MLRWIRQAFSPRAAAEPALSQLSVRARCSEHLSASAVIEEFRQTAESEAERSPELAKWLDISVEGLPNSREAGLAVKGSCSSSRFFHGIPARAHGSAIHHDRSIRFSPSASPSNSAAQS